MVSIDLARAPRIRVAAVIDTWIISGPGRQLAALTHALAPLGVDVLIIMFQRDGRPPSPFIDYMTKLAVEHVVIRDGGRFDAGVVRRLAAVLREFRPDIVQAHGYRPTGLVRLLQLKRPKWRWLGFFHGATRQDFKDDLFNRIAFAMLKGAKRLVVLSAEHRDWFAALGERVWIIHNACLALPSPKTPLDLEALRAPGRHLVGVVARLSHEKGVDLLIEALAKLSADGLDVHLVVAGDGPEERTLRAQAAKLGMSANVHFIGRIDDVVGLYRQIDILAIPSRRGAEGLPNVLLEAMVADLPVVATRVAAVPEVLGDSAAGRVVMPGDVNGIAQAIRDLLHIGRSDDARAARAEIVLRFSLENRARRHLAVYRDLLGQA